MSDTTNNTQKTEQKSTSNTTSLFGAVSILFFLSLAFIVPLGLWFSMVYTVSEGVVNSLLLFFGIYGLALLVTLLYYRMGVQDDIEAKVDKISSGKVKFIMATTFASFCILLYYSPCIGDESRTCDYFENTIGIWVLGVLGHSGFLPKFSSRNYLVNCKKNRLKCSIKTFY